MGKVTSLIIAYLVGVLNGVLLVHVYSTSPKNEIVRGIKMPEIIAEKPVSRITTKNATLEKIVTDGKNVEQPVGNHEGDNRYCSNIHEIFEVMDKTGTDKTGRHGYHWFYGKHFKPYKSKRNLKMLEIGEMEGRSSAAWTNYFDDVTLDSISYGGAGNKLKFKNQVGCKLGDCSRTTRFNGDQSDTDFLDSVIEKRKDGWDIIIDDASHVPAHNIITFEHLWKNIKPGGIYVIEDIETSYCPKCKLYGYSFQAGMAAPPEQNVLKRFQLYADVMNRGYFPGSVRGYSLFPEDHLLEEIGYSRNIVFARKANGCSVSNKTSLDYPNNPANLPGRRSMVPVVRATKKKFLEGSKYLDQWRTAPSFKNNTMNN